MKTITAVRAIEDPEARLDAAARLVRDATRRKEEAVALRDNATVCAHIDFDVPPVVLYRDDLGVSRALFNRMVQRANRKSPIEQIRASVTKAKGRRIETGEDMRAVARKAAADVRKYDKIAKEARDIRDDTGRPLMDGEFGKPMTNAAFARAAGITTARAAQIRGGAGGHIEERVPA